VVPGGIGTVLELAMIWQLLQVRKLHRTPPILIGKVWVDLIEWGRGHLSDPCLGIGGISLATVSNNESTNARCT
jgi:predicted Rossmann-fold nucleotide-binding protein